MLQGSYCLYNVYDFIASYIQYVYAIIIQVAMYSYLAYIASYVAALLY